MSSSTLDHLSTHVPLWACTRTRFLEGYCDSMTMKFCLLTTPGNVINRSAERVCKLYNCIRSPLTRLGYRAGAFCWLKYVYHTHEWRPRRVVSVYLLDRIIIPVLYTRRHSKDRQWQMALDFKRQPLKGLLKAYVYLMLSSGLLRLPWWLLSNATPTQRPRRSWSLLRCIRVLAIRFAFETSSRRWLQSSTH